MAKEITADGGKAVGLGADVSDPSAVNAMVADVVDSVACRYTMAPRNRFAVGALPETPQVLVAAACSGHGFKFGPAIGAGLADLALGKQRPDLDVFSPGELG